jgi:UDP-N-acetylmuramoylalanine--D-glutamate ligase
MDATAHFKGKKITVMGLGLLGRGLGDVRYLASCGAELIVTDLKTEEQLSSSLEELKDVSGVTYVLGEHRLEDFRERDFILKAAGVPLNSPYIEEAGRNGIPVKMSASWFAEIADIPVIGVTGTRGKSTTTHMIHAVLEHAGFPMLLGGNVRGVSTLALLPEVEIGSIALLELDSWQLQGFGDAKRSPNIAVFTTFFPDHMNYYPDMDTYLADKAQIFLYQQPTDTLVLGGQCAELIQEKYADRINAFVVTVGAHDFRADWELPIPGEHNRYDAALAVEAARAMDVDDETIREALADFKGVPGRLELVREVDGVSYYNDTTATTPDAVVAALSALTERHAGKIALVTGGADKGLDMDPYVDAVRQHASHVTLLAGTGTERVRGAFPDATVCESLAEAFNDARAHAEAGGAVVLSPGFASFGMFKNEYDRGDQFNALVSALKEAS